MAIPPIGPGNGPTPGQAFDAADLANKSPQELLKMLGDPNLSADQKAAVKDALKKVLEKDCAGKTGGAGNQDDGGGGGMDDLLKKLLSDEKLDPAEKDKLKKELMKSGLTEDQANSVIKNGEESGNPAPPDPGEIQ